MFFTSGEEQGHVDIHVTQSFTAIFLILKVFNLDKTASAAIVTDEKTT